MICLPLKRPLPRMVSPKRARSRSVVFSPPPPDSVPMLSTVKYASCSAPIGCQIRSESSLASDWPEALRTIHASTSALTVL
ncbi:hypothetical protein D3C87_1993730 [compost metagenome]